jgi:aromatic ring-cleaving dioxygenase
MSRVAGSVPGALLRAAPRPDHIDHAVWLGSVLPLRMNVLRKSRKTPSHS